MPELVTLRLNPRELAYLKRAAARDLDDAELDDDAALEAAHAIVLLRLIDRVEQEQLYPH